MPKRGGFSRLRGRDWSFRGHMPTFGSTISLGSSALYVMHHSPCRWPNRDRTDRTSGNPGFHATQMCHSLGYAPSVWFMVCRLIVARPVQWRLHL